MKNSTITEELDVQTVLMRLRFIETAMRDMKETFDEFIVSFELLQKRIDEISDAKHQIERANLQKGLRSPVAAPPRGSYPNGKIHSR